MATYNKRGYKPKKKVEKVVEEEIDIDVKDSTTAEVFASLDEGASKTEEWVEKNQKVIFGVIIIILIGALAYMAYGKFIKDPKIVEASNELTVAQKSFTTALETTNTNVKDSLYLVALNGSQGKFGLLDVADKYAGTPSANLAHYYAGMSYLEIKDYKNAISHLEDFSSNDMMLGPLAQGAIGDAFMQLDQTDEALTHYENAFRLNKNDFTTPRFLFKAAVAAIDLTKNDIAVTYLNRIKDEYKDSDYASQVDMYLGKAQAGN